MKPLIVVAIEGDHDGPKETLQYDNDAALLVSLLMDGGIKTYPIQLSIYNCKKCGNVHAKIMVEGASLLRSVPAAFDETRIELSFPIPEERKGNHG